jgi:hypothetical protein
VDHHRRLQDTELSEITGASLTAEEVRRYHQWVHHHRSLEDTEIQELLNTPQGSPQHEDT